MVKKKDRKRRAGAAGAAQAPAGGGRLGALLERLEGAAGPVAVRELAEFQELRKEWAQLAPALERRLARSTRQEFVRLVAVVAAAEDAELSRRLERTLRDKLLSLETIRQVLAVWPAPAKESRDRIAAWLEQAEAVVATVASQASPAAHGKAADALLPELARRLRGLPRAFRYGAYEEIVERSPEACRGVVLALAGSDGALADDLAQWLQHADSQAAAEFAGLLVAAVPATDKQTSKAVRTAVHRLRDRGYAVEVAETEGEERLFRLERPQVLPALLSRGDVQGFRVLWLFLPFRLTHITCWYFLLNEVTGIARFEAVETTRKRAREVREAFREQSPLPLHDIEPAYACCLIDEAYALNHATGQPAPQDFVMRRPEMEQVRGEVSGPIIYNLVEAAEIRANPWFLSRSGELATAHGAGKWFPDEERLRSLSKRHRALDERRIILPGDRERQQLGSFEEEAARELYDEPTRQLFKRRLEAIAFDLWLEGREEDARSAVAAALAFAEEPFRPAAHPFAQAALEGLLERLEEEREEEQSTRLIVTPEEERRRLEAERAARLRGRPLPAWPPPR